MAPSPPSARISEKREAWRTSREEILRLLLDEASAGAPAEEARAVRLTILAHDAQGDVGVARTRRTAFGARLATAGRALRIKCAALHRVLALPTRGGGPLPAVAPEVDAAAGALRLRIVDLGLVPRRALQLLQLRLLSRDDRIVVRGDLTAQRGEVLLRRVAAAERDKPLRLLVELRALLLHGRAEPVHSRLAVRAPSSPPLLCERGQAQIRGYADNDCLVHGHVPFIFTEASLPLTSQERNRA